MPQKPTMPSPYMTTVDATEPITFSCEIDSRDLIVDYKLNIQKLNTNNDKTVVLSDDIKIPPYFIGSKTLSDSCRSFVCFYKQSEEDNEVTMTVMPTWKPSEGWTKKDNHIYDADYSSSSVENFTIYGQVIERASIKHIIFVSNEKEGFYFIPAYYFKNFVNLSKIDFLGKVEYIYENVFEGCNQLKEVVFPSTLGKCSVINTALKGNQSIEKITIPHTNLVYTSSNTQKPTTLFDIKEIVVNNILPPSENITSSVLGRYMYMNKEYQFCPFKNLTKLERVVFNCEVTEILTESFCNCINLSDIGCLDSLKIIGTKAFFNCQNLREVFFETMNVEEIDGYAFRKSGINRLLITERLEYISVDSFKECNNLDTVIVTGQNPLLEVVSPIMGNCTLSETRVYSRDFTTNTITLLNTIRNDRVNVMLYDIHDAPGYMSVPIRGGETLSVELSKNVLQNNHEYCWNIELIDEYGSAYISPNYYFRTQKRHDLSIIPNYQEVVNRYDVTSKESVDCLTVAYPISVDKPFLVSFDSDIVLPDNEGVIVPQLYVEEKTIKQKVYESSVYNNDTLVLSYLPLQDSEGKYYVNANLPHTITQETVNDSGKETTEQITLEKRVVIYLDMIDEVQGAGVESPIAYSIVGYSDTVDDLTNETSYFVDYDTPFVGGGIYTITYSREADINSYTHTFEAEYCNASEDVITPIKINRWTLYEIDGNGEFLVDDSGFVYGSQLKYTYSKFLPNHTYNLYLEVENDEGMISKTMKTFHTSAYSADLIDVPKIMVDRNQNAIVISLFDASNFYSIIRKDIERSEYKLIAENISGEQRIFDLTAASNGVYKYIVYVVNSNGMMAVWESDDVCPDWCKVSIIGFTGSFADNSPIEINDSDIWYFGLNISNIEYQQNISKTLSVGTSSKYPHIMSGHTSYGKFNVTALIGEVDNAESEYVSDNIIKIEKWENFVASAKAKLIVDTKGRVCVCDTTANTNSIDTNYIKQPTTINTEFTEIASSNKISLIMIKAGV